jgi:hypothetical protein
LPSTATASSPRSPRRPGSAGLAGLAAARRACSATIDTDSAQVHLMAATHGDQLVLGQVGVEVKTNAKQQR